jgi:hypothetical protein
MTHPEQPASGRGARPQLFSASAAQKPQKRRSSGQPDFGPSILATIDGGTARHGTSPDRLPLRRVLWMSLAALAAVALYFGVKFAVSPASAPEWASAPRQNLAAAAPQIQPLTEPASASQGAAAIENVAVPAPAPGAASSVAPQASASVQQMLEREEPTVVRTAALAAPAQRKPAEKSTDRATDRPAAKAAAPAPAPQTAANKKAAGDRDTDLLAAMLPHLKRRELAPTSPAYDKRCGQLSGSAAEECRARFCNGRQGSDAACPAAQP